MISKLVLVEDEPAILLGIASMIKKLGLALEVAGCFDSSREALEKIPELKPDIILTDIQMPEISGLELIGRMKALLPDAEYLILSGYAQFDYAREAMRLGVANYLLKPPTTKELTSALSELCQKTEEKIKKKQKALLSALIHNQTVSKEDLLSLPQGSLRLYLINLGNYGEEAGAAEENALPFSPECLSDEIEKNGFFPDSFLIIDSFYPNLKLLLTVIPENRSAEDRLRESRSAESFSTGSLSTGSLSSGSFSSGSLSSGSLSSGSLSSGKLSSGSLSSGKLSAKNCSDSGLDGFLRKYFLNSRPSATIVKSLPFSGYEELYEVCSRCRAVLKTSLIPGKTQFLLQPEAASQSLTRIEDVVNEIFLDMKKDLSKEISIEDYSRKYGYNTNYILTQFSAGKGISPKKLLISLRMQKACELMRTTRMSIKEISQSVGYNDTAYFSKAFREYAGENPRAFREKN